MNQLSEQISNLIKQKASLIGRIFAAILLLLSLYILAKLIWLWVDYAQPTQVIQARPIAVDNGAKKSIINVNQLAALHIFGEANAKVVEQAVEAEETKLNLKLLGLYISNEEPLNSAIIQSNGNKQKTYWIGDKLEVRGNVTLHQVETEQVIIKNNGKFETLTLLENLNQDILNSKVETASKKIDGRTIDKRKDARLSKQLENIRNKIGQSPASFADLANFSPVIDANGQVAGFKISPGKDPTMFTNLGLRRNDVVRSINGTVLDNQAIWALQESLQSSNSLEVSIERNGRPLTLLVNIGSSTDEPSNTNVRKIK